MHLDKKDIRVVKRSRANDKGIRNRGFISGSDLHNFNILASQQ